jgi:hypothetical protein
MKIDEKIKKHFQNFVLNVPNSPKFLGHIYADFIELVALLSFKDEVTTSDILDRFNDENITINEDNDVVDVNNSEIDEIGSNSSRIDDKKTEVITGYFDILEYRADFWGIDYPFYIKNRVIHLKSDLTDKNKLYLLLLISAQLEYFTLFIPELSNEFEKLSYQCLCSFLPSKAIIKQFGKHSDYSGSAESKIRQLAKDMNLTVREIEIKSISPHNCQEKGLDLIGWIPFHDKIPNFLSILGQCACGKDWTEKQLETDRYENYFDFYKNKPIHSIFIPYDLNTSTNSFFQTGDICKVLVFDRRRILEYIKDSSVFNKLTSSKIVEQCINYRLDNVT